MAVGLTLLLGSRYLASCRKKVVKVNDDGLLYQLQDLKKKYLRNCKYFKLSGLSSFVFEVTSLLHKIVQIEIEIKIEMHIVFSLKIQLILFIKESSGKKENGKGKQKKKRKQKVQKKKKKKAGWTL